MFLTFICLAKFLKFLPLFVLAIYACTSLLTFILYRIDKRAAENGTQRIPESTLQLLSFAGGWSGGLFSQKVFRHKSTKKSFQWVNWATVFFNIPVLFVIASPWGRHLFKTLLGL